MDDTQNGTTSSSAQVTEGAPATEPRPLAVRLMKRLEGATWLDKTVDLEQKLAAKALTASPSLLALLRGRPVGHAVHPPMTDVPIGSWVSASVLDLVGGRSARPAARLLLGLGCLSALPTMLTGTAEWIGTKEGDKRVGYVHAVANGTSLAGYAASWWVRRDDSRHGLGVALALASGAVAGIGGYLGGHLSVARDIGTRDPAYVDTPGARELYSPHRD
ncbi:DUF2231 domain-containing protein [uncultured Pseudokineococcus sp.]|uniref:DUF2231 domain-containing protein n=1 Tax=uncultured Pseudokineococcus sp. TaxID=1642928 RepID=UPI002614458D|nr:DUF2231 domain-containing protein [uncultured Pseudokineococcus sp.]